jgi:hypothetical protein
MTRLITFISPDSCLNIAAAFCLNSGVTSEGRSTGAASGDGAAPSFKQGT